MRRYQQPQELNIVRLLRIPSILCSFRWRRFQERWIRSVFPVGDSETGSAVNQDTKRNSITTLVSESVPKSIWATARALMKGRCGVFAGNSVWSTSERLVVEILTIGAMQVHFPFLYYANWNVQKRDSAQLTTGYCYSTNRTIDCRN